MCAVLHNAAEGREPILVVLPNARRGLNLANKTGRAGAKLRRQHRGGCMRNSRYLIVATLVGLAVAGPACTQKAADETTKTSDAAFDKTKAATNTALDAAKEGAATTIDDIIRETLAATSSEREGRLIDTDQPFDALRDRYLVTPRARRAADDPAFSVRIREGLDTAP